MVHIDSNRIDFIPEEERWEAEYDHNEHKEDRDEYYVVTFGRKTSCPDNDEEFDRPLSSIRITRNFETQRFVVYIDGESVLKAQWAGSTPGRGGPNSHYDVLMGIKLFVKGWMAAEEEIPVNDLIVDIDQK